MWDYNKLFAKGNFVCWKSKNCPDYTRGAFIYKGQTDGYKTNFANKLLENKAEEYIQYIIRLDEHGNVVEKLFDRERDIKALFPELKTGYFIECVNGLIGVIVNDKIIFNNGGFGTLDGFNLKTGEALYNEDCSIIKVWNENGLGFSYVSVVDPVWTKE